MTQTLFDALTSRNARLVIPEGTLPNTLIADALPSEPSHYAKVLVVSPVASHAWWTRKLRERNVKHTLLSPSALRKNMEELRTATYDLIFVDAGIEGFLNGRNLIEVMRRSQRVWLRQESLPEGDLNDLDLYHLS